MLRIDNKLAFSIFTMTVGVLVKRESSIFHTTMFPDFVPHASFLYPPQAKHKLYILGNFKSSLAASIFTGFFFFGFAYMCA